MCDKGDLLCIYLLQTEFYKFYMWFAWQLLYGTGCPGAWTCTLKRMLSGQIFYELRPLS